MNLSKRYLVVDFFKSIAIIIVLVTHQVAWQYINFDTGELRYENAYLMFAFLGTAIIPALIYMLPLLGGLTFFLAISKKYVSFTKFILFVFLFLCIGYLYNFLTAGIETYIKYKIVNWHEIIAWDILHFIALSMLVSFSILKLIPNKKVSVSLLAIISLVALYFSDKYPMYQYGHKYLYMIFFGSRQVGTYWPFFPWFALYSTGIFIGMILPFKNKKSRGILLSFAILFLWIYFCHVLFDPKVKYYFWESYSFDNIWGASLFKPSPFFVMGLIGFNVILFIAVNFYIKKSNSFRMFLKRSNLMCFGQGILWIFACVSIIQYHVTVWTMEYIEMTFVQSIFVFMLYISIFIYLGYLIGKLVSINKNIQYYEYEED